MVQTIEPRVPERASDFTQDAVSEIPSDLRQVLADVFSLYLKAKNLHWHMTGRHVRDYHLLLDEKAAQIFAMTDEGAERARKISGPTLRSDHAELPAREI